MFEHLKISYKAIRSVLFSAIIFVGTLIVALYVLLAIPAVQKKIGDFAAKELSEFLGGEVIIGEVSIFPFNEVVLKDVKLNTPKGEECLKVKRLGAGINLWRFLQERKIEITYAEVIGLDGHISKERADGEMNIQFIIDALSPKDKNKPPVKFDLKIRNIVIRQSALTYDNKYVPIVKKSYRFDSNHIRIEKLNADILLPCLKNDEYEIDVRRISMVLSPDFRLSSLKFKAHITSKEAILQDFMLELPHSHIALNSQHVSYSNLKEFKNAILNENHNLSIENSVVVPSDFKCFYPALKSFNTPWSVNISGEVGTDNIDVKEFKLNNKAENVSFLCSAIMQNYKDIENASVDISKLNLKIPGNVVKEVSDLLPVALPEFLKRAEEFGNIELNCSATGDFNTGLCKAELRLLSAVGDVKGECLAKINDFKNNRFRDVRLKGNVSVNDFNTAILIEKLPVTDLTLNGECDFETNHGNLNGSANVEIESATYKDKRFENIIVSCEKKGDNIKGLLKSDNKYLNVDFSGEMFMAGALSQIQGEALINNVDLSLFKPVSNGEPYNIGGEIRFNLTGNNEENITGELTADNIHLSNGKKELRLNNLTINAAGLDNQGKIREFDITSDWVDVQGRLSVPIRKMPDKILALINNALPLTQQFVKPKVQYSKADDNDEILEAVVKLKPVENPYRFFNIPLVPLVDSKVEIVFNDKTDCLNLDADFPFLLQGKNKLIQQTSLNMSLNGNQKDGEVCLHTLYPAKKGDVEVDVTLQGESDVISGLVELNKSQESSFNGNLSFESVFKKDSITGKEVITLNFNPSLFKLNEVEWKVNPSTIKYSDKYLEINNLIVSNGKQFVDIEGVGSTSSTESISVKLSEVDLDYIFDTLNINYVSFGGIATGEVTASALFSNSPELKTKELRVKNLSYNGGLLGDGDLSSSFDTKEKKVLIKADIKEKDRRRAIVDGGIWVTRDSLSFSLEADKVDIAFLKPFMSAFSSDVKGRASGKAKLYGTFSDIDLVGRLFADTISMKVDYTNVTYSGSDSVIMTPGRILIPSIRLYDRYGRSGVLSGEVRHRYFHEPTFEFKLREADRLLCYDTNPQMNNIWYGTVYGTGSGSIKGDDSLVAINVDMTTNENTDFTFVLTDMQEADEYKFLTFTDKKKAQEELLKEQEEPDFISMFKKKIDQNSGGETVIDMDLRATITPDATLNLIMDPAAGDRIKANGTGSVQMEYNSSSDELKMYGKYILEQGHYNFSLQDIILRDFSIKPGSEISFNGDPMNAMLDIAATYRVNTNLSDLDKSFTTDRDLNRTNVPVDAVLMVSGPMSTPDISFDIDLPTLTDEVERKVKSIISTDDQMSRQVIYLLALNRFYTPEYMGNSSNGGEWASVASSTISSQLSNMLGQLTDKVSVMPSIRSDKGDFSDVEVDLALSSRLLNNRLLLNGNFGYRDKSTSSTTFIGDFDIEYILTQNGTLRLKAYNHFNDENYYLKSALTTQGVGIVVRKDFDKFSLGELIRRKKNKNSGEESNKQGKKNK